MHEQSISALVIARDEQAQLGGCLDALRWVDECVMVVDAASRDATESIARGRANRVQVRPFDGFAAQRNAALALAQGDWVLSVDADERVTPQLAREIRAAVSRAGNDTVAFRVPIKSVVFGRPFRYSGTQLDRPIRLFRRGAGQWTGKVHETVAISGHVGTFCTPLLHQTHETLHDFLAKMNRYTDLEAEQLFSAGVRPRCFDLTLRPLWTFTKLFVARQGFRDGLEGFLFCALSGVSVASRGWKLRELCRAPDAIAQSASPQAPAYGNLFQAGDPA